MCEFVINMVYIGSLIFWIFHIIIKIVIDVKIVELYLQDFFGILEDSSTSF